MRFIAGITKPPTCNCARASFHHLREWLLKGRQRHRMTGLSNFAVRPLLAILRLSVIGPKPDLRAARKQPLNQFVRAQQQRWTNRDTKRLLDR